MKKIILAAATLIATGLTLAGPVHAADWQNRGDDDWRRSDRYSQDDDSGRRYSDRRDDDGDRWRHDDNDRRDDWRRDRWRHHGWHDGWRHGWRPGYGPRIVIRPGFEPVCFIKKVRFYDDWGNLHIRRIPVCR